MVMGTAFCPRQTSSTTGPLDTRIHCRSRSETELVVQQVSPGNYQTAHYAISTGFMALCMMLTGMASGALQAAIGNKWFFIIVMFATVPSLIVSWLAPFPVDTEHDPAVAASNK